MNPYNPQQSLSKTFKDNQLMQQKASDKITTYVQTYLNPSEMQYNRFQPFEDLAKYAKYINVEIPSKINNLNLQIGNYEKTLKQLEEEKK